MMTIVSHKQRECDIYVILSFLIYKGQILIITGSLRLFVFI